MNSVSALIRRTLLPHVYRPLALVATLAVAALNASADTLAGWNVSGSTNWGVSPMAATTTGANVTIGGLTRGSGVGISGTPTTKAWGGNTWTSASEAAAITASQFATFAVTANAGYHVSFSSLSKFNYRRSATGAASGTIQYQIGSGAFTDITTVSYSSTNSTGRRLRPST